MRVDRSHHTLLLLAALCCQSALAQADIGIDVNAGSSAEDYEYSNGFRSVTAQKITLSPWWENDNWRLATSVPLVMREETYGGTVMVWRPLLQTWVPVAISGSESDSGLGDVSLRATRTWRFDKGLSAYVGSYVKLPTGNEDAGSTALATPQSQSTRKGNYSLGTGTTDAGISPGVAYSGELFWAGAEAGFITSSGGAVPEEDRPAAYLGAGFTPASFVEFSIAFDYEGEVAAGAGELEQFTYTLTVTPRKSLAVSVSTFTDNSAVSPETNWSLAVNLGW